MHCPGCNTAGSSIASALPATHSRSEGDRQVLTKGGFQDRHAVHGISIVSDGDTFKTQHHVHTILDI